MCDRSELEPAGPGGGVGGGGGVCVYPLGPWQVLLSLALNFSG